MKRIVMLGLAMAMMWMAVAQEGRPKVAVVLSGGGAKGVAHIGALKVIEEAGLPVDIVCGTSMGSLVGGLYSIGYSTATLDSLVRNQNWAHLLSDRIDPSMLNLDELQREQLYMFEHEVNLSSSAPRGGGVIAGLNLDRLFNHLCQGYNDSMDFNSFPIPFACVATNIVDNTEVDFHSGRLAQAMRSSMAIPGVFTPVRMGDMVLVDGGLRNNYPVDIARELGADIVIGVSVQGPPATADDLVGTIDVMNQIIDVNCKNKYDRNLAMSDVVIRVNVEGYSSASFTEEAIDTLLLRGEREARAHWDELVAIRDGLGLGDGEVQHPSRKAAPMVVSSTRHVHSSPMVRVGLRFDTEELGAMQLGVVAPLGLEVPTDIDVELRLGRRIMARAELNSFFNFAYTFRRNEEDIYQSGMRSMNARYLQHEVSLNPLNIKLQHNLIKVGMSWDLFDYYGRILTVSSPAVMPSDASYFSYQAEMVHNTENDWYFPTKGNRMRLWAAFRTTEIFAFNTEKGLVDLSAYWRGNTTITSSMTLQAMAFGRVVYGDNVPYCYKNVIGGEWLGHFKMQQLPFPGLRHYELVGNNVAAIGLTLDQRLGKSHHLLLRLTAGVDDEKIDSMLKWPNLYAAQLGYSYSSILGPIDVRLGYSTQSQGLFFFMSFGHVF